MAARRVKHNAFELSGCRRQSALERVVRLWPERSELKERRLQYLLTEDERQALVHKDELTKRDNALAAAREKLLLLAGFDCIHDKQGRNAGGYCSGCPCSPIHGGNDYVCWLAKSYPQ